VTDVDVEPEAQEAFDKPGVGPADDTARLRLAWRQMPLLSSLRRQVHADRPLRGWRLAAAMHISAETVHLVVTLRDAGAQVLLVPSSSDTISATAMDELRRRAIPVQFLNEDGVSRVDRLAAFGPQLLIDNSALLTATAGNPELAGNLVGATVHSSNGERVVRSLLAKGAHPRLPVVAIADSALKRAIETPAGTGQSTVLALVRATGIQLSGKQAVVVGYGSAGSGIARYLDGMRARVTVVDTSPVACLRALSDGHDVDVLGNALSGASVVIVATGTRNVITGPQFDLLGDGVILGNIGHYPDAVDVTGLRAVADSAAYLGDGVEEFRLGSRTVLLLGHGAQLNHVCGGGNSSETMDLTLSLHVMCLLRLARSPSTFPPGVNPVPDSISEDVARAKLRILGHVI
jgi:adenosylhomocysteinase